MQKTPIDEAAPPHSAATNGVTLHNTTGYGNGGGGHLYLPACILRLWPSFSLISGFSPPSATCREVAAEEQQQHRRPPPTVSCPSCYAVSQSLHQLRSATDGGGSNMVMNLQHREEDMVTVKPRTVKKQKQPPLAELEGYNVATAAEAAVPSPERMKHESKEIEDEVQHAIDASMGRHEAIVSDVDSGSEDGCGNAEIGRDVGGGDGEIGCEVGGEEAEIGGGDGGAEAIFEHLLSTWRLPGHARLSSMTPNMYRRLQRHFRNRKPPECNTCKSVSYVRFRYFNNFRKSNVLQPRYVCRSPSHQGKCSEFSQPHPSTTTSINTAKSPPPPQAEPPISTADLRQILPRLHPPPIAASGGSNFVFNECLSLTPAATLDNNHHNAVPSYGHVMQNSSDTILPPQMHPGGVLFAATSTPAASGAGGGYYYPYLFALPVQQQPLPPAAGTPYVHNGMYRPDMVHIPRNNNTSAGTLSWRTGGGVGGAAQSSSSVVVANTFVAENS